MCAVTLDLGFESAERGRLGGGAILTKASRRGRLRFMHPFVVKSSFLFELFVVLHGGCCCHACFRLFEECEVEALHEDGVVCVAAEVPALFLNL